MMMISTMKKRMMKMMITNNKKMLVKITAKVKAIMMVSLQVRKRR